VPLFGLDGLRCADPMRDEQAVAGFDEFAEHFGGAAEIGMRRGDGLDCGCSPVLACAPRGVRQEGRPLMKKPRRLSHRT
jgi:hypothetical protein